MSIEETPVAPAPAVPDPAVFAEEWESWHRERDARLADPHGWLAITALHWLSDEPQTFSGAPGRWSTGPEGVVVELDAGTELVVGSETVRGRHLFGVVPERGGVDAVWEDTVIEVAKRGGHDVIRPRHPGHPARTAFTGTPAYAPDPRWVVEGRYEVFEAPRPTTVGASVEGLRHVYDAPGRVVFRLDGREFALTAFNGHAPGTLTVLFTDATSGVTTYAANRSLAVDVSGPGDAVVLDFNRAVNLPCAYTDFATCPLPPAENRLPVAVEAGERIPRERGPVGGPSE
ncbi:DUF1684 domain-containing protein [Streptomyces termitum]|uniref:DUF1684 domain-containing protein n=1 Tax=Streptomyces termitum TaxID=67368 RepID=A0A918T4W2_9ACTN|nr:DUF1684 domain-containing protein [Streptomyces termitum]GHA90547.1 hypothetical protein GCM10010305_37740 [Streptomyces termitum]